MEGEAAEWHVRVVQRTVFSGWRRHARYKARKELQRRVAVRHFYFRQLQVSTP